MGARRSLLCLGLAVFATALAGPARAQPDWRISDAERVVAVADIHGAYDAFERILRRAEVIDESGGWSGGTTHLVIVGDVLDRGAESRRALDLIMRLEAEAPASGGRVHMVLGNHEVMNMTGDLRYVSAGEYAAFAGEETDGIRDRAFTRYLAATGDASDPDAARAAFDRTFPRGFFAHRQAFSATGRYGAWLRDKPVLVVVNGVAFVHAGLAAAAIDLGAATNPTLGETLRDYLDALAVLTEAGVLAPTDDFYDHEARIRDYSARVDAGEAAWPANAEAAADTILGLQSAALFLPDSPVWYRGNVSCSRLSEQDRLAAALDAIAARQLVVGHTPTPDALVLSRMDEALLRIDTGMLRDYYGGRASALVIADGEIDALYEDETAASRPVPQPRRVGVRPAGMSAEALEAYLARAEVLSSSDFEGSERLLALRDGDIELQGLFAPAERDGILPPVAVYRLDRLLGLDMVPVTVAREVDGTAGSLQYFPPRAISERERSEQGLGGSAWCPLGDQIRDMTVFDVLIYNEARTADRIRYSTENFDVLLVGHDRTLSTSRGTPDYLAQAEFELTPAWRSALASLDEASLTEAIGDVLDRRRIRALLTRRDALLERDR